MSTKRTCEIFDCRPESLNQRIYDLRFIPWLHIATVRVDGLGAAYQVTIDEDLKGICEGRRPSRSGERPNDFCQRLLAELIRRREEINDKNIRGRWLPDHVSKLELKLILDWIQGELEHFNGGQSDQWARESRATITPIEWVRRMQMLRKVKSN